MTTIPRLVSYQIRSYGRTIFGGTLLVESYPIRTHQQLDQAHDEWVTNIKDNFFKQYTDVSPDGIAVQILAVSTFEASK